MYGDTEIHTNGNLSFGLGMVGLNRTSRPVRKSGKFSNVRIPDFRFFYFPDSGPIEIEKKSKKKNFKKKNSKKKFQKFFSIFFS